MFEMKNLKADELLKYLNDNKGEVIYLEDTHNDYWTLIFRKTVMGRPKREAQDTVQDTVQIEVDAREIVGPDLPPNGFGY